MIYVIMTGGMLHENARALDHRTTPLSKPPEPRSSVQSLSHDHLGRVRMDLHDLTLLDLHTYSQSERRKFPMAVGSEDLRLPSKRKKL
jgi:hypothetical protein